MSYTEEIARPLIETLSKTAGLPTFQLAGHVPNLHFWMSEARHALDVIGGYPQRFEAMVKAQSEFDLHYPDAAKRRAAHEYDYQPARLALSPALAERLTQEIVTTATRLIDRCLKEELIDLVIADDLREALGEGDRGSPYHNSL
jgi:hypothetical protein